MSAGVPKESKPVNRFQYSRVVRWVDTDASGMVHLAALIRMMEETEYAFLRSRGLSVVLTDGRGMMGFPRLSAQIEVVNAVGFDTEVNVELFLILLDGKTIHYDFVITASDQSVVATGKVVVAVCRFPAGEPPYAILTPEYVLEALTKPGAIVSM